MPTMDLNNWLVVIAGAGIVIGVVAGVYFYVRAERYRERGALLQRHFDQLQSDKNQLTELLTIAQKEIGALTAHKETFGQTQETMKVEFRNAANQLFEEVSQKFTTQSEKKIGDILLPLSQRIGEFQKNVDEKFGAQGKEQHTLKAEIGRIVTMNEQMRLQTESLTKALRGDVKAQGNWGEVMLERILDESGLVKGRDYITQGESMGLQGAEGNRLKPDVIVNLPGNQHIIIDSKVSLTAYERYCRETDDAQKELHLQEFIRSLKNHVIGLEKKRYQDIEGLNTPEIVLMFMPLEGAFSLAIQNDHELHSFAWNRKVGFVSPSTLYVTLVAVASAWRVENQNRNVFEIAKEAGNLYDKVVGFVGDMEDIGKKLAGTQDAYSNAFKKLRDGQGNIIRRVENLKILGAKTTKSLPKEMLQNDEPEEAA
jgi:DNA recombination protein RmuC